MEPSQVQERDEPTRLERAGDIAARVGSLQPSDPNLRRGLHASLAIIVALSVGLAALAAAGDFPDVDWRFRPVALLIAVLALTVYLVASAEIWRRLLHALGPSLSPLRGASIWFASGLGRYVPTGALLPLLRVAMAERNGVPKRITFASVVYELALFFTASLIVGAYFVITLPDLAGQWERFLVLVFPVVGVVALQPRFFHTIADKILLRLGREPLPLSLPGWRVWEFVALYACATLVAGVGIYGLSQSVYPVGTDDIPTVVGSYAVANTFSILAFLIPGGLGVREAGMVVALSPVMPTAPALAVAVLSRILQLGLEVALALLTPLLARRRKGRGSGQKRGSPSTVDFNRYRDSYRDEVQESLALPGAEVEYFVRAKAMQLVELSREIGDPGDLDALDVGCGTGETDRFLEGRFGSLSGVDIAPELIERAAEANPWADYRSYSAGEPIPRPDESADLTFAICVLHHVPPSERRQFVREMARVTRPGGMVAIFEHNPWNPLTRASVRNCEFDEDAVLLSRREAKRLLATAGLDAMRSPYIVFFTREGRILSGIERGLGWLPAGAQYYAASRRPNGTGD